MENKKLTDRLRSLMNNIKTHEKYARREKKYKMKIIKKLSNQIKALDNTAERLRKSLDKEIKECNNGKILEDIFRKDLNKFFPNGRIIFIN